MIPPIPINQTFDEGLPLNEQTCLRTVTQEITTAEGLIEKIPVIMETTHPYENVSSDFFNLKNSIQNGLPLHNCQPLNLNSIDSILNDAKSIDNRLETEVSNNSIQSTNDSQTSQNN